MTLDSSQFIVAGQRATTRFEKLYVFNLLKCPLGCGFLPEHLLEFHINWHESEKERRLS